MVSNFIRRDGPLQTDAPRPLLDPDEPSAVMKSNPSGLSPFLLIGDHAGNLVPRNLNRLGLDDIELGRHIGWDIGIADLGGALAARLDAVFIAQRYSRLVIDCNRAPGAVDAIPAVSDGTTIAGNAAPDAAARLAAIHTPYQDAIAAEIARRTARAQATVLIALHSFTPVMRGQVRPWHVGILHNGANDAFAKALLARLASDPGLIVGDNEPYAMDRIDYTVPRHAFAAGLPYAEIEIRQDLLASGEGVAAWADRLERDLPTVLKALTL